MVKKGSVWSSSQGPTTWYMGGLLLSSFVLFGRQYLTSARLSEPAARLVDDEAPSSKNERGQTIRGDVNAQELYRAYESIRDEYRAKAFHCDHERGVPTVGGMTSDECHGKWRTLKATDGIEVSMMDHPTDPGVPYVRMSGVLEASVGDVWSYTGLDNWDQSMATADPFYEGLDVAGTYVLSDDNHAAKRRRRKPTTNNVLSAPPERVEIVLARKRTTRILTFGKRDFTFVQVSDLPREEDGVWTSGTVSVATDVMPRVEGYTRGFQDSVSFYEPLAEERTRITVVFRYDLNDNDAAKGTGGAVPMWLYVKNVGHIATMAIRNMRKEVKKFAAQRRAAASNTSAAADDDESHQSEDASTSREHKNVFVRSWRSWLRRIRREEPVKMLS